MTYNDIFNTKVQTNESATVYSFTAPEKAHFTCPEDQKIITGSFSDLFESITINVVYIEDSVTINYKANDDNLGQVSVSQQNYSEHTTKPRYKLDCKVCNKVYYKEWGILLTINYNLRRHFVDSLKHFKQLLIE